MFVNSDVIPHDIMGGPDPNRPDCHEIDAVGFLTPGQSRMTAPPGACGGVPIRPRKQLAPSHETMQPVAGPVDRNTGYSPGTSKASRVGIRNALVALSPDPFSSA